MRFYDSKADKAAAKTTEIYEEMVAKVVPHLVSSWRNEAASYQTSTPAGNQDAVTESRTWVANTAIEEPWVTERPRQGRQAPDWDARPVRNAQTRRPVYQPVRLFGIGGIFSANRPDALGRIDRERWPGETQPGRGPRNRGGGCSIPGCTCG